MRRRRSPGSRRRARGGQWLCAPELLDAEPPRQIEERERIPAGGLDELLGELRRNAHVRTVIQERDSGPASRPPSSSSGTPLMRNAWPRAAKSMTTPSALSRRAANASAPCRRLVEPLHVVDHAEERAVVWPAARRLSVAAPM